MIELSGRIHPVFRMTAPKSAFSNQRICLWFLYFSIFSFFFRGQMKGEPEDSEQQRIIKVRRPHKRANPAASGEQCSRACRDKRTARRAIRRELSEQMSPRGANVESKACQLARKAGPTTNRPNQRAEIVNCARVGAINLKSGIKTKATTGCSKTRALAKRVPFRIKSNFLKFDHTV